MLYSSGPTEFTWGEGRGGLKAEGFKALKYPRP